jgi:hypothetical protein
VTPGSLTGVSFGAFVVVVAIDAGLATLVFRHAHRRKNRHATPAADAPVPGWIASACAAAVLHAVEVMTVSKSRVLSQPQKEGSSGMMT